MTFDQYANQGGAAAWDPAAAAANKKAADQIFRESAQIDESGAGLDDADESTEANPKADDPDQPGEMPDPDMTVDP